jgi:hypothetical protein
VGLPGKRFKRMKKNLSVIAWILLCLVTRLVGQSRRSPDDIVTEKLSLGVPRTVAEIEALKKTDGLLQLYGDTTLKQGKR